MATRFVRIDLTDEARDFRPIAIEPGVPLLDRSNSNAKVLLRWAGGLTAEPVWEDESVSFYARDDSGGRLEEVNPQPATSDDLAGLLKADVATLRERLEKAVPETSTERALKKTLLRSLQEMLDNPHRTDLDDYFFRYRDVQGRWRLVWCWGYQRVDQEPAPAVVCTDPDCGLLFVRRPGQSAKCPACEKAWAARPRQRRDWKTPALVLLLLALLLGAGWYWWTHPTRLIAEPATWTGPIGSRIEFTIVKAGLFSKEDVTRQAVPIVLDPQVARLDPSGDAARAIGIGRTLVRFHLGNLQADATLVVGAARPPQRLAIEPRTIDLGVGTTARPKVIGYFDDGVEADLTDAVAWSAEKSEVVYAYDGLLEGIAEGTSAVTASYQAAGQPAVEATATVTVAKIDVQSLELSVDPSQVGMGRASRLQIDALAEDGRRYSVLESSMLASEVTPAYVAVVEGRGLTGKNAGRGKLAVSFAERHSAGAEFEVVGTGVERLTVYPEKLELVVGQIADLSIAAPPGEPVRVVSLLPDVVEITPDNRLVARAEGAATVEVSQGAEKRLVAVSVAHAVFQGIVMEPGQLVVPVDDSRRPRVLGRIDADRQVELSPDFVEVDAAPSPRFAAVERRWLELRGVRPTEPSQPQRLAIRQGNHQASVPVSVVVAPLRLTLSPPGPIDLPLGQMMRLNGWATYSGGRRVLVPAERLQWHDEKPDGAVAGLELRGHRVAALKAGAGPLPVYASYFGRQSNRVTFKSVDAADVALRLEIDRPVRLAGETSIVALSGTGPKGDVELVPELARFQSSSEAVAIDETSGAIRAASPGRATMTASHAASKQPATLELRVYDPAGARLLFEPASVRLAVDEIAHLPLYLEVTEAERTERVPLVGPGVGYSLGQPQAVRWQAPWLAGVAPAAPFELTASFAPILGSTASARVEVTAAAEPAALRIVPAESSLAEGQMVVLRVEQQLAGDGDDWREVRPDAVAWTVPAGLIWSAPRDALRAAAIMPTGAGQFELRAHYRGQQAAAVLSAGAAPSLAADARLMVAREPDGMFVPVGGVQRYQIVSEQGGKLVPAAAVVWQEDFENDFVAWQAPVLTAKRGGYEQWLRAEAGGRTVLLRVYTYEPSALVRSMPRGDQPVAVKILSDQITAPGQAVRFAVGAEFDDFRVEAHYADGFTRVVTKKATLRTPEPPQSAIVSASSGRLTGVRPGATRVSAEFDGVASQEPLPVEVGAALDVDQIRLAPSPVTMLRGESLALEAVGYKNGKSVGIITGVGQLQWQSTNVQTVQMSGPSAIGRAIGQASVTATMGGIVSEPALIDVVDSLADPLMVEPRVVRLRVGESVRLGSDLTVYRGQQDVSASVNLSPVQAQVVRFEPATRSLVGVSPGSSAVTVAMGDKLTTLMVEVAPGLGPIDGMVVVEPASGTLAPGQAIDMRAYVITPSGDRIDRTESALWTSSDPSRVRMMAGKACAVAAGAARITASLPGAQQTGAAQIAINDEEIAELLVDPPRLSLAVGDAAHLRVLGRAASGTHELYPQPDLKLSAAGAMPTAIRIADPAEVLGVSEGEASVMVDWKGRLQQQAGVSVTNQPWTGLAIEPANAAIYTGQALAYQVSALRGGQRRVLGPESGVQLYTGDQDVAQSSGGMIVRGTRPGQTLVVAQFGNQRAETSLDVLAGSPAGDVLGDVLGGGPAGYVVDGGGHWVGDRWIDGGADVVRRPLANAAGLRFVPEVVRLSTDTPSQPLRVFEILADGTLGRDVSADPQLELTEPPGVVRIEKTASGPALRPIAAGQTRVGARLGELTADALLVEVGAQTPGMARLIVAPDPLAIWSGEEGTFTSVRVDPGAGQLPFEVDYRLSVPEAQGVVAAVGDRGLRGLAPGVAQVVVTALDAAGTHNGLTAVATVQVGAADQLVVEPSEMSLQIGETTPPLAVMAQSADGIRYQVPAALQSADANVLAPDPEAPGRFIAKGLGETQLRADHRGRSAFAKVAVAGKRFLDVQTSDPASTDETSFDITIEVLAAGSEGPLEYRVYGAGQAPAETWVPAQVQGDMRQVTLRSPRMNYGPRGALYHLVIEARAADGAAPQQYPLTFRLKEGIERLDRSR